MNDAVSTDEDTAVTYRCIGE
ncbi:hypothetical protein [Vibrio harveyi]